MAVGIAAGVASAAIAWYLFIPPAFAFNVDVRTGFALGVFALIVGTQIALVHHLSQSARRLARVRDDLVASRDQQANLFHELQHRTANNLAFVVALLSLGRRRVSDPQAVEVIDDACLRIDLLSQIHRRLYDVDAARIAFDEHCRDLCEDLMGLAGRSDVAVVVEVENLPLGLTRAVTLSMLISELATNSLKHGFAQGRSGRIWVRLSETEGTALLTVEDDGAGKPEGGTPAPSLGSKIIDSFVQQLSGRIDRLPRPGGGYRTVVAFPLTAAD